MAHPLDNVPIYFGMFSAKLFCKHIYGFTDNLDMFYEAIEKNRVSFHLLEGVAVLVLHQRIDGIQDMF